MVRHVSSSKLTTKTINRSINTLLPIQQTHYTDGPELMLENLFGKATC